QHSWGIKFFIHGFPVEFEYKKPKDLAKIHPESRWIWGRYFYLKNALALVIVRIKRYLLDYSCCKVNIEII
ncbi:hypothetical protein, partial [Oceanobacillus sp. CFH 90083]|uniref:hypothetical protein n=1 Tax=Oceanobacillus sp. CFH 90083 TaxID=2592336 RepID=UPI001D139E50